MAELFEIRVIADDFDAFASRLDSALDDFQDSFRPELERWGARFTTVAKAYPFPKRDIMRSIDTRPHPRGPMPERLRDFWKFETQAEEGGAALDIWNEHPRAQWILFKTEGHPIPRSPLEYKLRWFDYQGGMHMKWSVVHPGTPGQPVHTETYDDLEQEFDQSLDDLINEFIRTVGGL